jgi:hypothetical protein
MKILVFIERFFYCFVLVGDGLRIFEERSKLADDDEITATGADIQFRDGSGQGRRREPLLVDQV